MDITHVKGIGPAKKTKLNDAGITTVHDLAHADTAALADKTGIKLDQLKSYKESAVALTLIEDVRGVGPGTVKTLAEAGIRSLQDLYEASSDRVAAEAKVAREKAVQWQDDARQLYERVKADAQTAEGRAKLAQEGKDLAVKAANATVTQAKQMLETAQTEGQAAIEWAKDFRENAPERYAEYKAKVEAILKDAETRINELREKAPAGVKDATVKAEAIAKDAQAKIVELRDRTAQVVKTETEKVKAANEGLLARIKAKFVKA